MKIAYIDINTGYIKRAKYFNYDYVTAQTHLKDRKGSIFTVAQWQLDITKGKNYSN